LRAWAHRKGVARQINYGGASDGRRRDALVETVIPSLWLAQYAAHFPPEYDRVRVTEVQRRGRLRRRYRVRAERRWQPVRSGSETIYGGIASADWSEDHG
jgi:hypothetical protein